MKYKNLAVMILSTEDENYDCFKVSQKLTWVKSLTEKGIKCYFYQASKSGDYILDDTIFVEAGDGIQFCASKFQKALALLKRQNPDVTFIYRTNLSSYIDCENFFKYIETIENPSRIYSGKFVSCNTIVEKGVSIKFKIKNVMRKININNRFLLKLVDYLFVVIFMVVKSMYKKNNVNLASGSGFFLGSEYFDMVISPPLNYYIDDVMIRIIINKDPDDDLLRYDFTPDYVPCGNLEYVRLMEQGLFHYRFKTNARALDSQLLFAIDDERTRERLMLFRN